MSDEISKSEPATIKEEHSDPIIKDDQEKLVSDDKETLINTDKDAPINPDKEMLISHHQESLNSDDKADLISDNKDTEIEAAEEKRNSDNTAVILNEKRELSPPMSEQEAKKNMSRRSRRSFLLGGVAGLAGVFGWRWMPDETKAALLNRTFRLNERVSQIFFGSNDLAPEFSKDQRTEARTNGGEGLSDGFDPAAWKLRVGGLANRSDDLILTLDDIKALPRVEMTTELKCIEGWSMIVSWAGVRFSDFSAKYQTATTQYVSLMTPDEGYFVGWDMPSMMHPQTLLAYEMNGEPLTLEHGAPLRIATTTKYGIKQIKRIGRIDFTNERPRDFWAEQGYDWYSGH